MLNNFHIYSEIGTLRQVLVHCPGKELLNLFPDNLDELLFDDIPFLEIAQQEHNAFVNAMKKEGVEVFYLEDLLTTAIDNAKNVKEKLITDFLEEADLHSIDMKTKVKELLLSKTKTIDFVRHLYEGVRTDDVELNFENNFSLSDTLYTQQIYTRPLLVNPLPNAYFTRDTFSVIGDGVSINSMRFQSRRRETLLSEIIFNHHPALTNTKIWHNRHTKAALEGGDILILNKNTIAIGVSERTEALGIDELAKNLLSDVSSGFEKIYAFTIPNKRSFMHLDTVLTQIDYDMFAVHPEILHNLNIFEITYNTKNDSLNISAVEGKFANILANILDVPSVNLIECGGGDPIAGPREQWNDGSNTLALSPGKICVYQRNSITNEAFYKAGIELIELPSAEISRGRGGPHCMSMALVRDDL